MKVYSYSLAIVLAIISLTTSCGPKVDKNDPLYVEVMAIHDEVMPKMSTIHKLKKKLRKSDNAKSPEVLSIMADLDAADEGMMQWMADFSPPSDKATRKTYLEGQLISVKKMAADINTAIAAAEQQLATTTK